MNRKLSLAFSKAVIVISIVLNGCGDIGSTDDSETAKAKSAGSPLDHPAQSLGLRIMSEDPSGSDPTVPDVHASLDVTTALDDFTTDQTEIDLHTKLFLVDSLSANSAKKLEHFFVWPEKSLGSAISSANYSHRIKTVQGHQIGTLVPRPVWHDIQNHRWFIPVSDIYKNLKGYGPTDVNLEDTQVMSVELTLESGRLITIDVKFQVSGPMTAPVVVSQGFQIPSKTDDLIRTTSKTSWMIQKEEITNPTTRPFHLWIRHKLAPGPLLLHSHLEVPTYRLMPNDPPLKGQDFYLSSGNLEVSQLEVLHQSNRVELRNLTYNTWEKVILEPNEKVVLSWRASPSNSSVRCTLPPAQIIPYHWMEIPPQSYEIRHVDIPTAESLIKLVPTVRQEIRIPLPITPIPRSIAHTIDWTFVGAQLTGQWEKEIRLAHPFISPADATRDPSASTSPVEYIVLDRSTVLTDISVGNIQGTRGGFPCQGVYP